MQAEATHHAREADMDLQFIGMDSETDTDHCPTMWVDAEFAV
ncbi:hypothetical protein ACIGXA_30300 [Streptomyces fildesensis]|uniref:Uncharacterized protein n=1 Tax=Streptomyces fildesensis TaxID=375757 RepID=A0ABW8CEF3_9ACTN